MAPLVRSTVDRLDRPSAYYNNKVSFLEESVSDFVLTAFQNKRRRDRDDDGDDAPAQPQVDPLANATTLYVGNLYVDLHFSIQNYFSCLT